ncbi:MAG: hypothetical protein CO093_04830 [Alphaproteobacteria bacterium CG_4_9_14_3_um_filter_47_13]|nr:MAG: hypothetical protein CO093_04830 [Alphaproteobacteria bacterium CG_4_9_14_3_um_filter_47_13]
MASKKNDRKDKDQTVKEDLKKKSPAQSAMEKKKKKIKKIKRVAAGVVLFLLFIIWFGMQPLKAGKGYGICRTYVELNIRYPTTYKVLQYDEFGSSIRLFYTYKDEFGGTRSDMIECILKADPVNGYVAESISINRKPIDSEKLAYFNRTIPGILAQNPDLVIPSPVDKDDFLALRRE